jgi:DNA-3-methyladenine glycosylase
MDAVTPEKILAAPKLSRSFYSKEDTAALARELLGSYLVHNSPTGTRIGRIVEVEAYLGVHDRAAHSHRGRTPRTEVMFGPPGHAYVYLIYGIHCCMNVVSGPTGQASAILLRGLEPVLGLEGRSNGPGLLTRAIDIDRRHNGIDLLGDELFLTAGPRTATTHRIMSRPRIGVDYAGAWAKRLLRFYVRDNPFVSRP